MDKSQALYTEGIRSLSSSVILLEIRDCFRKIAEEEKYHMELVERIMNIINNCI
jgi:hypothetical protein